MSDDRLMRGLAHMSGMGSQLEVFTVAKPAAGAQWAFTIPGGLVAHVRGITAKLTASAVAGNRIPAITVDDQSNIVAAAASAATTIANGATTYAWNDEYGAVNATIAGGFAGVALPSLVVPAGYEIKSVCSAFDVGDQWSNIVVWCETIDANPYGVEQFRNALDLVALVASSPFLSGGQQ